MILFYDIIASTIKGSSIPSIIGWTRSKRDVRKLNYFHKQISLLNGDGKLDEKDIESLDQLRGNIIDAYSRGNLNEKHYENLKNETSVHYEKIFRRKDFTDLRGNELYRIRVNSKVVIVSGGAIESSNLLQKSNIGGWIFD